MSDRRPPLALVVLAALLLGGAARADELARRAREHFALAEAAERRGDYATAIDEYKLAYAIKAHPVVLYDIAVDYEKLERWDAAVDYYRRYLGDAPDAADRDKVRAKIEELDKKSAAARPPPPRGEGTLVVHADVEARVRVDGTELGHTPMSLPVPAGHHRVALAREGYGPVEREVDVAAGGTEEIKEQMPRLAGTPDPVVPDKPAHWVLGLEYGFDYAPSFAMRALVTAAIRWENDHLELGVLYGFFGTGNIAYGLEARGFLFTSLLRPYLRAAATIGESAPESIVAGEAGLGLLIAPVVEAGKFGVQFSIEAGARYLFSGALDTTMTPTSEDHRPRLAVSLTAGFLIPF